MNRNEPPTDRRFLLWHSLSMSFRVGAIAALSIAPGCRSFSAPPTPWSRPPIGAESDNPIRQVSGESDEGQTASAGGNADTELASPTTTDRVMNFLAGRATVDKNAAKTAYQEADALFRSASTMPREEARKEFAKAAKKFKQANEAATGTALGQDALFMQAESEFFADQLTTAAESYQRLQKEYPRNRHGDQAAARLFSISRYWIEIEKKSGGSWVPNLTDPTRPRLDPDGHAIRVLDQIRFDDPAGKLADDATMAAAAEHIRQGKFDLADEFLTDLRETYSDSQHLFHAHLLGILCKLEIYAGPSYSNLLLVEADKLIEQTRRRFPEQLREEKYAEMLARSAAQVSFLKAERLNKRAEFRDKQGEHRSAARYYQQILDEHSDTPFAETARERLGQIAGLPPEPAQRLSFLTKIFRDSKQKPPFEMVSPGKSSEEGSVLR